MNQQKPSKVTKPQDRLYIHSIFQTIQGEGPLSGRPAIFVRFSGCNLQCPLCDTEYSTYIEKIEDALNAYYVVLEITASLKYMPIVVITGGEPFRQPGELNALINRLISRGFKVQIETNGTLFTQLSAWGLNNTNCKNPLIVCSPKTDTINKRLIPYIYAFKYVINHESVSEDGLPSTVLGHPTTRPVRRPPPTFPKNRIYVQPEDSGNQLQNDLNLAAAIKSAEEHGYTLCLQLHKIIQLP